MSDRIPDASILEDAIKLAESSNQWERYRACPRLLEEIHALRTLLAASRAVMVYHNGHKDDCTAACDAWDGHVCYQPESVQAKCSCGLGKALKRLSRLTEATDEDS